MQVRAIFDAACELRKEGKNPFPEVMIPLVATEKELKLQRDITVKAAAESMKR
jgi:pyruvate,orthophosphate dikinase